MKVSWCRGKDPLFPVVFVLLQLTFLINIFSPMEVLAQNLIQERDHLKMERNLGVDLEMALTLTRDVMTNLQKEGMQAEKIPSLLALFDRIRAEDLLIREHQKEVTEQLRYEGASGMIMNRQARMSAAYTEEMGRLLAEMEEITQATGAKNLPVMERAIVVLFRHLEEQVTQPERTPLGVSLPYRALDLPQKAPQPGAAIVPAYLDRGLPFPSESDLADGPEVSLTPEILAQARTLEQNPIEIFEFVQNQVAMEFYYGAMKGAAETLRQRRGNDIDQASLLIALMRASGIPARYVRGVIQLSGEQALSWTTLSSTRRVAVMLTLAGIPFKPIYTGGAIGDFELEHTWVEIYVPYGNYRGVPLDPSGKVWIPLDPSLKEIRYDPGVDLLSAMNFRSDLLVSEYLSIPQILSPANFYRKKIVAYLTQYRPDLTFEDVLGRRTGEPVFMGLLPSTLPYPTISVNEEGAALPEWLRHHVRFVAEGEAGTSLDLTIPVSELLGRRLTLSYIPATVEDQIAVEAFLGIDQTPAYLVKLLPVLKVGGAIVGAGEIPVQMGVIYPFSMEIQTPRGMIPINNLVVAGGYYAIGLGSQKVIYQHPVVPPPEDTERTAADLLYGLTVKYLEGWNQAEEFIADILRVVTVRPAISEVMVGNVYNRTFLFGQPQAVDWRGVFVDADLRISEPVPVGADIGSKKEFMRLSGLAGSLLENEILEQNLHVDAVSAARLIQLAHAEGIPVDEIDASNMGAVLPLLQTADAIKTEIADAVNQGWQATIPRSDLTRNIWTGVGYILIDPATGNGGYMISGSLAGGTSTEDPNDWVQQQYVNELGNPYQSPPNTDTAAAASIRKVAITDHQEGKVGETQTKPLAVWVRDQEGRPVQGAQVTFRIYAGGGHFVDDSGVEIATVTTLTNYLGVAIATPTLGKRTMDNPFFVKANPGDHHVTQVGLNIITASVSGMLGEIFLESPFQIFAYPGDPHHIVKILGDNNTTATGTSGGTILARVEDPYDNTLSNVNVSFTVLPAVPRSGPLPTTARNLVIYPNVPTCPNPNPILGDCNGVSHLAAETSVFGAAVESILGDTMDTRFQVSVAVTNNSNVPHQFFSLYSTGSRDYGFGDYYGATLNMVRSQLITDKGDLLSGAKVGTTFPRPLEVTLYMVQDNYLLVPTGSSCGTAPPAPPCFRIQSLETAWIRPVDNQKPGSISFAAQQVNAVTVARGAETATVTFTPVQGGGTTTAVENPGQGRYASRLTVGTEPVLNRVEVDATANVWVPDLDLYAGSVTPVIATLKPGQYASDFDTTLTPPIPPVILGSPYKKVHEVFGVRAAMSEKSVIVSAFGATTSDTDFKYLIEPPEYIAQIADVDLFTSDPSVMLESWTGFLSGNQTSGAGIATLVHGTEFDTSSSHRMQLVLNRGSEAEVKSEKVVVPVFDINLNSGNLDALDFPSPDGVASDLLISPQAWASSAQVCANLDLPFQTTDLIVYAIAEVPRLTLAHMIDLSNGANTGVLDMSNPKVCMHTKPAEPFPLESDVHLSFFHEGVLIKEVVLHLIPAIVVSRDIKLGTDVDRINGDACSSGAVLEFDILYDAMVTIAINGNVIGDQQDVPRQAGVHQVPITADMVPLPGENHFEITAAFDNTVPVIAATATGKIDHEVVINASFPIGHTMIKGVDIVSGHLTHSTQDVVIPGRGLSLDFTRSYSSSGNASDGPLGAGWTHSYNSRLVINRCGKYTVIGGEGSGNTFTPDGAGGFRPQIGYHSSLVQVSVVPGKEEFDFFTKSHVQYHFKRNDFSIVTSGVYPLSFIQEPNGNRITLDYLSGDNDPTTLDKVTDSSGRSLVFEYQTNVISDVVSPFAKVITSVRGSNPLANPPTDLLGLEITYEYDEFGNLFRVTRKSPDLTANLNDERVEVFAYTTLDPQDRHNLLSYTDPNGHTTTYDYFAATDPVPGNNAFLQSQIPTLLSIFGTQTSEEIAAFFGYWNKEIIKSVNQPEAVSTHFFYNFTNKTRLVTDPRAPDEPIPPTIYTLNNYGATVMIEEPLGKVTHMEWCTDAPSAACPDRNGNPGLDALMISKIDAEGRTHLYEYGDGLGNMTQAIIQFTGNNAPVTLKDGTTPVNEVSTTSTYEPTFSKVTGTTDAEGNQTLYLIDAAYPGKPNFCPDPTSGSTGNLLGIQDSLGNVACYSYGLNGDPKTATDSRGLTTHYVQYDSYGNPEIVQDPEGNITTNTFDERSRLKDTSDTFGHHGRFAYDGLDRKILQERLDDLGEGGTPQITVFRYTPSGEPETITDGLGQVTRLEYDGLNRNFRKTEEGVLQADGTMVALVWSYTYDKASNLKIETDPRCMSQTECVTRIYAYDALNRMRETRVQGPFTPADLILSTTTYDLVGNKLTETDLHGHTVQYGYDGLYRVVETDLPFSHNFMDLPQQSAVMKTAYDRQGNKVRETDPNGRPTTYVYDNIFRPIQKTDADGNKVAFTYDSVNNKTREENLSSGLVTEWRYHGSQCGSVDYDGLNRPKGMRQTGPGLPPSGYETCYTYEDNDNAIVVTNPRNFKSRIDKDGQGRVVQTIVDINGLHLTTTFAYDGNGNVKTIKDPQGGDIDVTNEYDGLNRKIRSTYVSTPSDGGQPVTEELFYDGNNNVIRSKDKRGIVFASTYDNLNRLLTKTVEETISNWGVELTAMAYVFDDANNRVTEADANGNVTVTAFDSLHRPVTIDEPDPSGLLVFEYDGVNKRTEIDKKGHRIKYDYDVINRPVETREFDLSGTLRTTLGIQYIDEQNQKKEIDRRGIATTSQMDALGRIVQLKRSGLDMATHYGSAEVLLVTHEYDGNGNKVAFIDGQGNRAESVYDSADRQITVTEGVGSPVAATTTTTYDSLGNVLTVKDGRSHSGVFDVEYTYDARYRKVSETNAELQTTTYGYDANNNIVHMKEPKGAAYTTRYRYDEFNKLLAVDERDRGDARTNAGVTRFFYDGNRNKIAQQDANGNLTTYRYDPLNRLTDTFQHTVPGSLTDATSRGPSPTGNPAGGNEATAFHWRFGYDLNGNQILIVDAKDQRVEKNYDYLDRLLTKFYFQHSDPALDFQMQSITYDYDDNGNPVTVSEVKKVSGTDATEVTLETYDPLDRLQTRTHHDYDDPAGKKVEYDYDIQGNRTEITDPDGLITTYTYDARNRLSTVNNEVGVTTYTYWEDSLIKLVEYPNGSLSDHSTVNAYDKADRSTLIINRPVDSTQQLFSIYAYTYDENSNRLTQVETQGTFNSGTPETTTYAYDNLNRVVSVTYGPEANPAGRLTYTYEPNGNRLSEQGRDPHTGQPINRTFKYEELSGNVGVTFNRVNALTQIVDNSDSSQSVTYEYDRNLNQVAKDKSGVRTAFHFGIRDEMLATGETATPIVFDYDHNGMRVKKIHGGLDGETRYLYDDSSVLVEYGSSAAALKTFHKYDYGYNLLSLTAIDPASQNRNSQFYLTDDLMSTSNLTDEAGGLIQSYRYDAWGRVRDQVGTSDNPRQYTGHYTDSETGLHYLGARYYDDETGRFLSQDPYLGEGTTPPSLHRYLYAYANPLRYVDLTGYQSEDAGTRRYNDIDEYHWARVMREADDYVATVNAEAAERAEGGVEKVRLAQAAEDQRIRELKRQVKTTIDIRIYKRYENAVDPTAGTGYGWAGQLVRDWEKIGRNVEHSLNQWEIDNPSGMKSKAAAAMAHGMELWVSKVQMLKFGEGAAESYETGDPLPALIDIGRGVDIAATVAPVLGAGAKTLGLAGKVEAAVAAGGADLTLGEGATLAKGLTGGRSTSVGALTGGVKRTQSGSAMALIAHGGQTGRKFITPIDLYVYTKPGELMGVDMARQVLRGNIPESASLRLIRRGTEMDELTLSQVENGIKKILSEGAVLKTGYVKGQGKLSGYLRSLKSQGYTGCHLLMCQATPGESVNIVRRAQGVDLKLSEAFSEEIGLGIFGKKGK